MFLLVHLPWDQTDRRQQEDPRKEGRRWSSCAGLCTSCERCAQTPHPGEGSLALARPQGLPVLWPTAPQPQQAWGSPPYLPSLLNNPSMFEGHSD